MAVTKSVWLAVSMGRMEHKYGSKNYRRQETFKPAYLRYSSIKRRVKTLKRRYSVLRYATEGRTTTSSLPTDYECDVVVIGAGLGGLATGALLALQGIDVIVVEAHSIPGGAAHCWKRNGYTFESGPSLYSGMTILILIVLL